MKREFLQNRPWAAMPDPLASVPLGMLGEAEQRLLYSLARDGYEGLGEIIDAGAFLGASSYCLASGLAQNDRVADKAGRLHAYDLFTVWREQGQTDEFVAGELRRAFGVEVGEGQNTLHLYTGNLGELTALTRIYPGDITKNQWSGRPIELFFIDICKSPPIWSHLVAEFYPSLIPGASVVVHQDYHHPLLPWIHVVQESLSPYFDLVDERQHDSATFFLSRRIPDRDLAAAAAYDFNVRQELRLMDRAIERLTGERRHVMLAKAHLLRLRGRLSDARELVDKVKESIQEEAESDPMLSLYAGMTEQYLLRDEIDQMEPPPGYNESAYLKANPDVKQAVRQGMLDSGLQHWVTWGRAEGRKLSSKNNE